jgi:hypothetical protein
MDKSCYYCKFVNLIDEITEDGYEKKIVCL